MWDPEICIDCARCALVCPHAAIRLKLAEPAELDGPRRSRCPARRSGQASTPGSQLSIQVSPDDCTGCGVCVDVCPARSKSIARHKAIDMVPIEEHGDVESCPLRACSTRSRSVDPARSTPPLRRGRRAGQPLFEFSGACAGCGETPYLKLLTQMFGDRSIIANATGCSSIYGGNLPTTPWTADPDGPGAGVGELAVRGQRRVRARHAHRARPSDGHRPPVCSGSWRRRSALELASTILVGRSRRPDRRCDDRPAAAHAALELDAAPRPDSSRRTVTIRRRPSRSLARRLTPLTGALVRKNVWIVGGDGWAYDIGAGGLDHVLGSGRDVNILVLDTEVYSNTGGQASKSTPRAAVAKFAAGGKATAKKDLGAEARRYGNVYVAQIAVGANDIQTVKAFAEAEAWPGPSLIIAYSTCIAHGIDMTTSMTPPEGRREVGLLAAVALPPERRRAHPAVPARLVPSRRSR